MGIHGPALGIGLQEFNLIAAAYGRAPPPKPTRGSFLRCFRKDEPFLLYLPSIYLPTRHPPPRFPKHSQTDAIKSLHQSLVIVTIRKKPNLAKADFDLY